jgi:hypothetical protein
MREKRQRFPSISEEMKAWSAALASELETWPQCRLRSFFGFHAVYRGPRIFGLLPRTRALDEGNSVAFKLKSAGPRILNRARQDRRILFTERQNARWMSFAISSDADLRDAMEWFARAYDAAR